MTTTETKEQTIDEISVRQTPFRDKLANVPMRVQGGGVQLENLEQQLSYAQLMAKDSLLIPEHLYNNPGTCLAVVDLSQRWGLSPFMVAKQTYMVPPSDDGKRPAQFGFMSQLLHAIIEKHAPIQHRLKMEIGRLEVDQKTGEERWVKNRLEPDNSKRIRVWTKIVGEIDDVEYISPTLAGITPKNSPLWKSDPDQQLFYFASSRLARRYFPDVLMGVYSVDEIQDAGQMPHVGFQNAKVVPQLQQRLEAATKHETAEGGFKDGIVEATLNGETKDEVVHETTAEKPKRRTKAAKPILPAGPATSEEYDTWLRVWLAMENNPEVIEERWKSEFKLRKACGCRGGEVGAAMLTRKNARLKELGQ